MINEIIIVIGGIFIGFLILGTIILLSWWARLRKIRKKAPEFEGSMEDLKNLNYDSQIIERRKMNNDNHKGRIGSFEKEIIGTGGGETPEEEIRRIRAEIRRREEELRSFRGS